MIKIERDGTTITTDDVAQAAALVHALAGMPAPAAAASSEPKVRKPRKARSTNGKGHAEAEAPKEGRGAVKAKILAYIAKHPAPEHGALAEHLYGVNDQPGRARVSAALGAFTKRGSLKRLANGEYRVA